jgi:hypothetical protein
LADKRVDKSAKAGEFKIEGAVSVRVHKARFIDLFDSNRKPGFLMDGTVDCGHTASAADAKGGKPGEAPCKVIHLN